MVEKSTEMRRLANKVIREHEDLHWIREAQIRIGFAMSDREKRNNQKVIYGECHKVPPLWSAWVPYDFCIVFYADAGLMDEEQLEILMWHELKHVGTDSAGTPMIVPHDIEDFYAIINEHGLGWNRTGAV